MIVKKVKESITSDLIGHYFYSSFFKKKTFLLVIIKSLLNVTLLLISDLIPFTIKCYFIYLYKILLF